MASKSLKTPCEVIVWEVLPVIRKELAKTLVSDYGYTQRKAAQTLGLTEATISRYIAGTRGHTDLLNRTMKKEVRTAVDHIVKGTPETVVLETCRLCHLLQEKGVLKSFCE